jgi:hypothetical protein
MLVLSNNHMAVILHLIASYCVSISESLQECIVVIRSFNNYSSMTTETPLSRKNNYFTTHTWLKCNKEDRPSKRPNEVDTETSRNAPRTYTNPNKSRMLVIPESRHSHLFLPPEVHSQLFPATWDALSRKFLLTRPSLSHSRDTSSAMVAKSADEVWSKEMDDEIF